MVRKLFLTPSTIPPDTVRRYLSIPNSQEWLGIVNKALIQTIYAYNYEQVHEGDLTPEQAADRAYEMVWEWFGEMEPQTQVRLNPENPCQLEISYDYGETWLALMNICELVADIAVTVGV